MDYAKMEPLIFLLVVAGSLLVRADDNVAMESSVGYQGTYKVHPDPEDMGQLNDQQAQAYQVVSQTFGKGVESPLKEFHAGRQNQIEGDPEKSKYSLGTAVNDAQNVQLVTHQHAVDYVPQDLGYKSAAVQPVTHQVYLQQYPNQQVHIFGAEASALQQVNEEKASGFSSFVEHLTEKDEEEIKSALKEGSVEDIKRLVPKSGVSFKIYHKEKPGSHAAGSEPGILAGLPIKVPETPLNSQIHHGIRIEVPEGPLSVHHEYQQATPAVEAPQLGYLGDHGSDQHSDHSQKSFLAAGKPPQTLRGVTAQTLYHKQAVQTDPHNASPLVPVVGEGSPVLGSHFKIQVHDVNSLKPAAAVNSLGGNAQLTKIKSGYAQTVAHQSHHQRHWNSPQGLQKTVKHVGLAAKPSGTLHYQIDPLAQAVAGKGLSHGFPNHAATVSAGAGVHPTANSYVESKGAKGGFSNFVGHSQAAAGKASPSGLSGHLEVGKGGQETLGNHLAGKLYVNNQGLTGEHGRLLGASAYSGSLGIQSGQKNADGHLSGTAYADSEPAKTSHHNVVSQAATGSYVDAKTSQNNFDHQKALEGSTSFDIKNAIGNAETLTHQTVGYVTPATEVHLEKQPLAYVVPKVPATTLLIGSHDGSGLEGHQLKHLLQSPQFAYHAAPSPAMADVTGKYFNQAHAVAGWSGEHLKQGSVLTANDLHQPVIKVHLPKEELLQHVKAHNVQIPTSFVAHNSFGHHKQPFGVIHEARGKFPQEFHFQPKKNLQVQNIRVSHLKPAQPVTVDWSLFKGHYPNFNLNAVQIKPELLAFAQDSGKKIVPILVRKRKNRSNKETAVVYGKVSNSRRPKQPSNQQENVQYNLLQQGTAAVAQYSPKGDRKNEFSVSASYKVDRSFQNNDSS